MRPFRAERGGPLRRKHHERHRHCGGAGQGALLAENNVNILDISQTILQGSFTMVMAVDVGASKASIGELRGLLDQLGERMGISIRIQREEIFDAMHRI